MRTTASTASCAACRTNVEILWPIERTRLTDLDLADDPVEAKGPLCTPVTIEADYVPEATSKQYTPRVDPTTRRVGLRLSTHWVVEIDRRADRDRAPDDRQFGAFG